MRPRTELDDESILTLRARPQLAVDRDRRVAGLYAQGNGPELALDVPGFNPGVPGIDSARIRSL
jgi:hypothetical protein